MNAMDPGGPLRARAGRGFLALAIGAFLPLAALAGFAVLEAAQAYRALDEARLRGTARALAAAVDARLAAYLTVATTVSNSPMLDEGGNQAAFLEGVRRVSRHFGVRMAMFGPAPDFPVLADSMDMPGEPGPPGLAGEVRALLEPTLRRVVEAGPPGFTDLLVGPASGRALVAAVVPVRRRDRVIGVLAIAVEPRALLDLLLRQDLPAGGFATIGDGRHRVLATTADPEGRRIGIQAPAWVEPAIGDRRSGLVTGPSLVGTDVVFAFERPSTAPDWVVVTANPLPVQRAQTWRAVGLAGGAGAALLLGLAALAWAGSRQTLRAARQESAALRAGRADIERLLGGLPAAVFLRSLEPDGSTRLLYRSGDIEGVYGWPAKDLPDNAVFERLGAPGTMALPDFLARVLREGRAMMEWQLRQPDGSWRWMRTRCLVLSRRPDGGAELVGYVVNIQAERAAAARAAASGRLAALGEMAAGLAHELKQPLAIISLAAENAVTALRAGRGAGAVPRLERIAAQAQRAGELIEHLRRFARGAEAGEVPRPVPLRQAVLGAMALVGSSLREAGVVVEIALEPSPGPVVMAQLVPLEQVLANLLANARDAFAGRPPGTPRWVRIASQDDPAAGQVRLTVADSAGGIPQPVLDRLFEPFVTTKEAEKGTGLGLSISHGLVGGMGGRIDAANGPEGAIFTIVLPAAPAVAEVAPA